MMKAIGRETDLAHVSPSVILLADGDMALLEALKVGLELTWPLATVCAAQEATSAIEHMVCSAPSIALIEQAMTAKDGESLLTWIRSITDVPIIVMSADDHETEIVRAFEMGADDVIVKPFGSFELLARMRALLRRSGITQGVMSEPPLIIGDITVHFSQRRVDVRGEPVHLTQVEHSVITALARELGRCISHRRLAAAAWGSPPRKCYDRLKACIWRLRSKIEPDPREPMYVQSVRGVGYMLIDPACDLPERRRMASQTGSVGL